MFPFNHRICSILFQVPWKIKESNFIIVKNQQHNKVLKTKHPPLMPILQLISLNHSSLNCILNHNIVKLMREDTNISHFFHGLARHIKDFSKINETTYKIFSSLQSSTITLKVAMWSIIGQIILVSKLENRES